MRTVALLAFAALAGARAEGLPPELTLKPGTFVSVRVNEWLSSARNQPGDAFSGTLTSPLVVDGYVVAQRGQTVGGRVTDIENPGRGRQRVSRLTLQLTELTVADGTQVPVESQLISLNPPDTRRRDAGTIAGTTGTGALIGAIAGRGPGAMIGGIAGLAAGVIMTRGRPAEVPPETALTFRLDGAATVSTAQAPQAFHPVQPEDYERRYATRGRPMGPRRRGWGMPPPPFYPYPWFF